jgi:hypothetical protein
MGTRVGQLANGRETPGVKIVAVDRAARASIDSLDAKTDRINHQGLIINNG